MLIRTPQELGAAVRGRRRRLRLSQAKVAQTAGVSRLWLNEFEGGKTTVELGHVLSVLAALDFTFELLAPDDATDVVAPDMSENRPNLDDLIAEYDRGSA
jgi:HTH-type transcriptional regulator/antitoxin HipB